MENLPTEAKPPARRSGIDVLRVIVATISGPLALVSVSFLFGFVLLYVTQGSPALSLENLQGEDERIFNVVFSGLVYVAALAALWLLLAKYLFASPPTGAGAFKALGLHQAIRPRDVGIAIIAFAGYLLTSIMVIALLSQIPGFNLNQPQDIGQSQPQMLSSYVIAFIGLVVLPPLYEELIFRGFMFGALRRYVSFWVSTILVSVAFAVVHGQPNVAADTFVLSIFLCALRERTGGIWAPILVHAFKNGLAFTMLFVLGTP